MPARFQPQCGQTGAVPSWRPQIRHRRIVWTFGPSLEEPAWQRVLVAQGGASQIGRVQMPRSLKTNIASLEGKRKPRDFGGWNSSDKANCGRQR
jgi:hypothetical protein